MPRHRYFRPEQYRPTISLPFKIAAPRPRSGFDKLTAGKSVAGLHDEAKNFLPPNIFYGVS